MKTENDFKVINGVASLKGISFAEEVRVVDMFLKNNPNIKYASLQTMDNRYFQLLDNKLIHTKEDKFLNPYYSEDLMEQEKIEQINNPVNNRISMLESKVKTMELLLDKYEIILSKMALVLNSIDN